MTPTPISVNQAAKATPSQYVVSGGVELALESAYAQFDGAASAAAWYPALGIYSPSGVLLARTFPASSIAAGGAADVTFVPLGLAAAGSSGVTVPMFEAWGTTGASPTITAGGGQPALTLNTTPKYDSTGGLITYAVSNTMLQIATPSGDSRWLCVVQSIIVPKTGPVGVAGTVYNMIADGSLGAYTGAVEAAYIPVGYPIAREYGSSLSTVLRTSDLTSKRVCIGAFNDTDVDWKWVGPGGGQNRITLLYLGLE